MRIALCQLPPAQGDVPANVATVVKTLTERSGAADVVVFPEVFLTGYDIGRDKVRGRSPSFLLSDIVTPLSVCARVLCVCRRLRLRLLFARLHFGDA